MNRVKLYLITAIFIAMAFSCSSDDPDDNKLNGGNSSPSNGVGSKGNDIANYKTKKIGNQTWMAENLDYAVEGSRCYDDAPANCTQYGRLYDWATAMDLPESCIRSFCDSQVSAKHRGICPAGWHIPNAEDWNILINYAGGTAIAGKYLKAASGWKGNDGEDKYGFAALPGGYSDLADYYLFLNVGDHGYWWSTGESFRINADHVYMISYSDGARLTGEIKQRLFSVRCIQD
jgi:uncharacterized protein (TIGR02145 family)